VATAKVLADLGYAEVNWNLGCPYPMVAKKSRGSGLLPHPDRIAAFFDAVCPRLGIALSVKLRLGRADRDEILRVMPILNAHPLSRVVLHPRLGVQMYKGEVDLEGFARAASLSTHRLGYNGDIKDLASFAAIRARFPAIQDFMIGRRAVADPFLAGRIKGEAPAGDRPDAMRAFHEDLYRGYREILFGPGHVLDKMKEIWTYIGQSFGGVRPALEAIGRAKTLADYEAAAREVFARGSWTGS
ncbi:MAG: tRNA-dihydrouridine synthase family protein, partial [Spirochaetaceae bacterium]|nr:tRNA-dihydrouridine synthase family protein [Spirochaetaceae bacterium]